MVIDLLFIILFVGSLALGFYQGVIRLSILLLSFYLGVVMASILFYPVGIFFMNRFGTHPSVGMYMAFAIVMMLCFALFATYGLYSVRDVQIPGHLMYVDKSTGVFVALILAGLLLGMFGVLLWNLMIVKGGARIDLPIMKFLGGQVRSSFLLQYFAVYILPMAYDFADPILPDGAQLIFAVGK
jgi:membrane protein required for colicin V production